MQEPNQSELWKTTLKYKKWICSVWPQKDGFLLCEIQEKNDFLSGSMWNLKFVMCMPINFKVYLIARKNST